MTIRSAQSSYAVESPIRSEPAPEEERDRTVAGAERTSVRVAESSRVLHDKVGTLDSLRKLVSGKLIPAVEKRGVNCLHLATGDKPAVGAGGAEQTCAPREKHHFAEMCFCVAGQAEIWAGAPAHKLDEGDVLIIPPETIHSAAAVHTVKMCPERAFSRLLWIAAFPYGCILNLCESLRGVHRSTPRVLLVERHVNAVIQGMLLELRNNDEYSGLIARYKLLEALALLCRGQEHRCPEKLFRTLSPPRATNSGDTSVASRAKAFLEQNFDTEMDLTMIARAVCLDRSHLCRVFKAATGLTVIDYLTKVRVEAARKLLLTGLSVVAVSNLVGFQDPYYFSRVFKKATGLSPTVFRNLTRQSSTH